MKPTITRTLYFSLVLSALLLTGCETLFGPAMDGTVRTVKSADEVQISYAVSGKGDTALVFVHCWTCDHSFWDQQVSHFTADNTVVWIDLAGHGLSGHGRKNYTMEAFGGDVASVVKHLNLKKVVLIDHSMGGPVSVEAEKQLGNRVIGVVGVDTFFTPFKFPKDKKGIRKFVKPFEDNYKQTSENMIRSMFPAGTDKTLIEHTVKIMTSANKNMGVSAMHNLFNWSAKHNPAVLNALGKKLRNINADPQGTNKPLHDSVVLVNGVGHFIPQENPAKFNQVLGNVVKRFKK